ncbi:carbohydrate kinase family protein [Sporosarcina sp. Marseille-Q4063]|uniref:carbohydrate kinase family protein n=1 Tax=Sporosarcina sp. Marseille-Q4063 TaxID=2810514 RepID=UPI001BB08153|nr:PfkB family carbohydrate kinase [Sporosarcina sp. Marseille-Q4063]QUW23039.1 carbohydrate kinase family protein [Sporosarcina sp. Marseille-Q4063]
MKYIIVSTAVTDETYQHGSLEPTVSLGGAGIYALAGVKIWTDEVILVTGVGSDFNRLHGKWFEDNQIITDHLFIKHEETPKTLVNYFEGGERKETPIFGNEHYRTMEATIDEIKRATHPEVKGIYIFKEADLEFWKAVLEIRKATGFKLMWEINANSANHSQIDNVKTIAEEIDIFSINISEAKTLLIKNDISDIISELFLWTTPFIFLRDGANGAYMIYGDEYVHISSVEQVNVVDATGGGNSSSAGVLYGLCEGFSAYEAGIIGSISASICIQQEGVPANLDYEVRKHANELLKNMR